MESKIIALLKELLAVAQNIKAAAKPPVTDLTEGVVDGLPHFGVDAFTYRKVRWPFHLGN